MKTKILVLILAALLISAVFPVYADEGTSQTWEPIFPSVKNRSAGSNTSGQSAFSSSETVSAGGNKSGQSAFSSSGTAAVVEEEPDSDEEQLLFTNFNDEPVKNKPTHYFPLTQDHDIVLVTKVRTYHWNNGNGAAPGTIGIYDTDSGERICGGQAIGRSAHGVPNVYWETLMECVIYPGHTYRVKVSDASTWSYNDGSDGAGMFELYGFDPMPEGYVISPQQTASAAISVSSPSGSSSSSSGTSYKVPEALTPGMFFEMGYMEQNNDPGDGPETLDWQVLTVQNDRALVINKRVIDYRPFANDWQSVRWDNSAIRKWLNDDFYNSVFTPEERSRILLVNNENPNNTRYGTWGGSATQDHIFLLSYDEANRYFYSNADRKSKRSKTSGTKVSFGTTGPDNTVVWALRSPGAADNMTAQVGADGVIDIYGTYNYSYSAPTLFAIRPAFWMKTKPTAAAKTGFRVRYEANDCLSVVPVDNNLYQPGETVMVMFEPVEYIGGLIFNGWDGDGDNAADYGYSYNSFTMPARDVVLRAVCFQQYHNQHYNNYGVTTGPVGPDYSVHPDPGFVPNHTDPMWMDGVG